MKAPLHRWYCVEVFAGKGSSSSALGRAGLLVLRPLEAFPNIGKIHRGDPRFPCHLNYRKDYVRMCDIMCSEAFHRFLSLLSCGVISYVHFGIPCGSSGSSNTFNKGTRCRSALDGCRPFERERPGNEQAQRVKLLCGVASSFGVLRTIENPSNSFLWVSSPFVSCGQC